MFAIKQMLSLALMAQKPSIHIAIVLLWKEIGSEDDGDSVSVAVGKCLETLHLELSHLFKFV